jgi:hypothetical protein
MQALSLLNHWLNGLSPALGVASLLTLVTGWVWRGQMAGTGWQRWGVTTVAAVLTLLGGLAWLGQDGAMRTYAALVVVCATVQWLFLRPWQRFRRRRA